MEGGEEVDEEVLCYVVEEGDGGECEVVGEGEIFGGEGEGSRGFFFFVR